MNKGINITYEFAAFFEDVCHGLLAWDVLSDLPETRHKIK